MATPSADYSLIFLIISHFFKSINSCFTRKCEFFVNAARRLYSTDVYYIIDIHKADINYTYLKGRMIKLIERVNDAASFLFHQGTNFYAYDYLGAHRLSSDDGIYRYVFRVWAPNADSVSLVGDFTDWTDCSIPMARDLTGVWEVTLERKYDIDGSRYKYAVTLDGITHLKADPYALYSETLGNTASIVYSLPDYTWRDRAWLRRRRLRGKRADHRYPYPLNIYEVHLGSWLRDEKGGYLSYRELGVRLSEYLTKMGYTHVELLPIAEHPFDGSWGYQVTGYYAPSSRYGTPADFMYFVDTMHEAGIGVILDWVPAHFPKDEAGLFEFDGKPLYEYQGCDRMENAVWGTRFFDVGRPEVQSFLISNALFWVREYHIDGLRVDAVASMLQLDYDRLPGEWIPNVYGGKRNLEAASFFAKLNRQVKAELPDVMMIAEESSERERITADTEDGGLGFTFKWNMGWTNDTFEYIESDPIYRASLHDRLTFDLMYTFDEHYILPISHDETVHGKRSLIDKFFGEYEEKFLAYRAYLIFMMTMPGKKLMFMGSEFAQFREWDYQNGLEWFMLDYPRHREISEFCESLNHFYLERRELWEIDDSWDGFSWLEADMREKNVIAYTRSDIRGRRICVIINFSPIELDELSVRMPHSGSYREIFASNFDASAPKIYTAKRDLGHEIRASLKLPPYGAIILEGIRRKGNGNAKK